MREPELIAHLRQMQSNGWTLEWEPATNFIGARHPRGGRQSIARIEGRWAAEIAELLLAIVAESTK